MIRSINQRMILVGLAPLALLAVALVVWNGFARIGEAEQELLDAQTLTRKLLNAPAVDALVVGNKLSFEQLVNDVIKTSPAHVCISLRDTSNHVLVEAGVCKNRASVADMFPITASTEGLSDFKDEAHGETRVGELRVSMSNQRLIEKKHQVVVQLVLSVGLILFVVLVVVRILRARVVIPIQKIDGAMQALSRQDYSVQLQLDGEDEVGRLGRAVNATIDTIAGYTRELVRRRDDADRALHDADEANLARDGLVRSLTEELEGPLSQMHADLTALAITNADSNQRERIKSIIATLQETQSNFDDLIEIATSSQPASRAPLRDFADFQSELQRAVRSLADTVGMPLHFEMSPSPPDELRGVTLDIDGQRCKKAVEYVIRAMYRHCNSIGVYVHVDVIKVSNTQLHISLQLKAFYEPSLSKSLASAFKPTLPHSKAPPSLLGWTDRECKIIEYLLREVNMTATYSSSPTGTVCVLLETLVRVASDQVNHSQSTDWTFATRPIHTTIVSDDPTLIRFTTRGTISNHEMKLLPFTVALENVAILKDADALVVDMGDDVASAFGLLEELKAANEKTPRLIALCAAGAISDVLEARLFDCGFKAVLQRPIQYARLVEVVQSVMSQSLVKYSVD